MQLQRTDRLRIVFVLLLSLLGTAALFLPFSYDVSPLYVVSAIPSIFLKGKLPSDWSVILFALPFFLPIAIFIWQVRKLLANQLSALELTAAYVLSAAAMISVLAYTVILLLNKGLDAHKSIEALMFIASCWTLAFANVVLLWRNLAKRVTREAAAEAFLLGGYLPNAVFCLIAFGLYGRSQIGAYLIAAVSLGYLAAIVLLSRQKPSGALA